MKAVQPSWKINYNDATNPRIVRHVIGPFNSIDDANAVKMATIVPAGTFPSVVVASEKIADEARVAAYATIYGVAK